MSYCNNLLFNKKSIILCSKFVLKLYFLNLDIEKLTVLQRLRKTVSFFIYYIGAEGRTRTGMRSLSADFESAASANFATSAYVIYLYSITYLLRFSKSF